MHMYLHEDLVEKSEQEALEAGGGDWSQSDLVSVVTNHKQR
jgi:hypothetical protein